MSEFDGIYFQSSGNLEQDEAIARDIQLTQGRLNDGICPNGCALLVLTAPNARECPVCKFTQWCNVPFS